MVILSPRGVVPSAWQQGRKFAIAIDAGSSGSRIQIYSWKKHEIAVSQLGSEKASSLPRVEKGDERGLNWQKKITPGISTLGPTPEKVPEYLRPLLDFAKDVIPPSELSHTPIYLMATAGMRLLPEDQKHAVLNAVCSFIKSSYAFKLDDCEQQIRVISGQEEGLFGWVAVNYLMGGFEKKKLEGTFGFLDMGGASAQIAFEPNAEETKKHANDLIHQRFRNLDGSEFEHDVFVTTWLGYGANQARNRYMNHLVDNYKKEHGDSSPKTNSEELMHIVDPCLPKGLSMQDEAHPEFAFNGDGDFAKCLAGTEPLLNKDAPCPDQPCLFDGVHVPNIDFDFNRFIGVAEYWYSSHDIFSLGGLYDFEEFEKHASNFCARSWHDLMVDFEGGNVFKPTVDNQQLQMQCFKASWVSNVLHAGIGIPRITDPGKHTHISNEESKEAVDKAKSLGWVPPFQSVDSINDVQVSWTLGKMVVHASQTVPIGGVKAVDKTIADDFDILPVASSANNYILFLAVFLTIIGISAILMGYRKFSRKLWNMLNKKRRDLGGVDYVLLEEGQMGTNPSSNLAHLSQPISRSVSPANGSAASIKSTPPRRPVLNLIITSNVSSGPPLGKHAKRFSGESWANIGANGKEVAYSSTSALSSPSLNPVFEEDVFAAKSSLERTASVQNLTKLRSVSRLDNLDNV